MTTLFDLPKENIPRLDQCFLCKAWALEADLHAAQVPDQTGWIGKPVCKACLEKILSPKGRGVGTVRVRKIL